MQLEAEARRYLAVSARKDVDPAVSITAPDVLERLPVIQPEVDRSRDPVVIDPVPVLAELGARASRGEPAGLLAAAFHRAIGEMTVDLAAASCRDHSISRVALGGGVFQNSLLLAIVAHGLESRGLEVLLPERLGPNDGAISYGQAVVAAARLAAEKGR